jgi:hypothetical protein
MTFLKLTEELGIFEAGIKVFEETVKSSEQQQLDRKL